MKEVGELGEWENEGNIWDPLEMEEEAINMLNVEMLN